MTTNKTLRNFRIVLWVLVAVAALGATFLYVFRPPQRPLGLNGQSFALNSTRDGKWRKVDIRSRRKEMVAVSRGGYFAPAR